MIVTATRKQNIFSLGVATAATAVIAWPILAHSQSLVPALSGVLLTWLWISSFIYLGAVKWPYHYAIAAAVVLLSFAAPAVSALAVGAKENDILVSTAIVGLLSITCLALILKRR